MPYELWIKTRAGGYVAGPLIGFEHLEWQLGLNRTGTLYAVFPAAELDKRLLNAQLMAELWINGSAEPMRLLQRYFIWDYGGDWQGGRRTLWIKGFDLNTLVTAMRIVTGAVESAETQKSGEATAVMAEYVTEALLTDAGRDVSDETAFEVLYAGNGATIAYTASRGQLGSVIEGCAGVSASLGIPVRWWVTPRIDGAQLRIAARPWGRDLRSATALSVELGTALDVKWSYVSSTSKNYGYIGGQGQKENRDVVEVDLSDGTALGRREMWAENSQILKGNTTALTAWGKARVWEQLPRKTAQATLQDSANFRFGYEWDLGDWFTIEDDGLAFQAEVMAVTGVADGNRNEIKAVLRSDDI